MSLPLSPLSLAPAGPRATLSCHGRPEARHWEGTFFRNLVSLGPNPAIARNVWQRLLDMIGSLGLEDAAKSSGVPGRKIFDDPFDGGRGAVFGLNEPLGHPMQVFRAGAQALGAKERVPQLHGPLDSASSTGTLLPKRNALRSLVGGLLLLTTACQASLPLVSCGSPRAESPVTTVIAQEPVAPRSPRQPRQRTDDSAEHDEAAPGVPCDATQGQSAPVKETPIDAQAGEDSLDLPSPRRGRSRDVLIGDSIEHPQRPGDWLNPAGAWASIASLFITVYVLVTVRALKQNLLARASLPRILSNLRKLDAALETKVDHQQLRIHIARLRSWLETVATLKTSPRVKHEAKTLLHWVNGATAEGVRRGLAEFMVTLESHLDEETLRGS